MERPRVHFAWLAAGLFALAALFCVPLAIEADALLADADDPVTIADRGLDRAFDRDTAIHEIEAALDANDADLARSFVELAEERRADQRVGNFRSPQRQMGRLGDGGGGDQENTDRGRRRHQGRWLLGQGDKQKSDL